ncbi:ATP-binding protein [Curtobacterium sp. C2H10]|uniref:ATP-binding protein n=1 Tax=Curtobacterium sp. C2H10 TaxID=2736664 RepID=UPI0021BF8273|nr:ATP-binding protein [Curtobacterium sp. C2H10]MCT9620960.1 ATP-binding protein [Curtobacterium sp. C2H10]
MTDPTQVAAPETIGVPIDTVWVEIDYAILQHFSKHLYSSPNKAVEELVTNGYDALATNVAVYTPGLTARNALLVWDNGSSMDTEDLKRLWWIARSPKLEVAEDRTAVSADGKIRRRMVGKFGIGKLASYAVGDRLAHLCRRGDDFLLVRVNYKDAPTLEATRDEGDRQRGFDAPMLRLTEDEAREFALELFTTRPDGFSALFDSPHWTLAIVDEIKDDAALPPGRLRWILGNGMPIRPDFKVQVDDVDVVPSALTGSFAAWSFDEKVLQESITTQWQNAKARYEVDGSPTFGSDQGPDATSMPWVDLPGLGKVFGEVLLFDTSLREGRAAEHGRSEGFFVYVRERLLNPDDPKLLLNDPSFGAFNRLHAVLRADGLDADLLADRERLGESDAAVALKTLQQAVYLAARQTIEKRDADDAQDTALATFLPTDSRDFFRQPLAALASSRSGPSGHRLNVARARVVQEPGEESAPLMSLRQETDELVLNQGHPLITAARRRFGGGPKALEAMRLVELLAVSDTLLAGFLLDLGLSDDLVQRISDWREGQVRSLAVSYEKRPEEVVEELQAASYKGGARFELALSQLFRLMGFVADRNGAPGEEDVLVVAPVGRQEARFTAEGKGKRAGKGAKDKMANDEAEISGASAHARSVEASFAIVVARDFQGFASKEGNSTAAIINECECQNPPVSIVTIEALIALYEAVKTNHYPLTTMIPVLAAIESPAAKLDRIAALARPLENFDVPALLGRIWELQQGDQNGMAIPILQLKASRPDWKAMDPDAFDRALYGLENLTGGLLVIVAEHAAVELLQSPEVVLAALPAAGSVASTS